MSYDLKVKQMEHELDRMKDELNKAKMKLKYKKCPLCYGTGEISTPSKEIDYQCWTCGGTGLVERND